MLLKAFIILMLIAIFVSLFSALVLLFKTREQRNASMAKALTWRIGLSFALFVLLMAGFYFGLIPGEGLPNR